MTNTRSLTIKKNLKIRYTMRLEMVKMLLYLKLGKTPNIPIFLSKFADIPKGVSKFQKYLTPLTICTICLVRFSPHIPSFMHIKKLQITSMEAQSRILALSVDFDNIKSLKHACKEVALGDTFEFKTLESEKRRY